MSCSNTKQEVHNVAVRQSTLRNLAHGAPTPGVMYGRERPPTPLRTPGLPAVEVEHENTMLKLWRQTATKLYQATGNTLNLTERSAAPPTPCGLPVGHQ